MKKRPSLGSNIDIFLSRTQRIDIKETLANEGGELRRLPVDKLQRGRYQPRKEITQEAVQELAESIRTQGVLQPIIVRSIAQDRYEIIAGERRWRATQLAGLTEIPALVKDIPDETALAIGLIENIQRENLNALEEAIALQRLSNEFGMTHQQVAEAVGKSRTTVTNLLRLLTLQPDVKQLVERGQIEMGHARALLALEGMTQSRAAQEVFMRGLSVRETEKLVAKLQAPSPTTINNVNKKMDPNISALQKNLSDKLGAAVLFQQQSSGKGKMVIHYNNLDELEGILEKIH